MKKTFKILLFLITLPFKIGSYLFYLILFGILLFVLFSCNSDNAYPLTEDEHYSEKRNYDLPYSFETSDFNFPTIIEEKLTQKTITEININQASSTPPEIHINNSLSTDLSYTILYEIISDIVERYPLFQSTNLEISITSHSASLVQEYCSKIILSTKLKDLCPTRESIYFILSHILARTILKNKIPSTELGFTADLMALEVVNNYLPQYDAITALDVYRNILYGNHNNTITEEWLRYHPQTIREPQLTSLLINFKTTEK